MNRGAVFALIMVSGAALPPPLALATAAQPPALVQAEAARERGDCVQASLLYATAAETLHDIAVARRASDLATACGVPAAQWRAAKRWRELDPENIESLRVLGMTALAQAKLAPAHEVFTALFNRSDVEIDRALQDLLPEIGEQDSEPAAWAVFRSVIDRKHISPDTRVALARLAGAAFDYAGAHAELEPALAAQPDSAPGQRLAARLATAGGHAEEALRAAAKATELDPAKQRFARAETLSDLDRIEEAQAELERLARIDESRDEAQRRLALLALSQADYEDARRRFGEILKAGGAASVEAFFYLGSIAELTGDKDGALATYQRLVKAGGGLLPRTRAAALLLERGDAAGAAKLFDDYQLSSPQEGISLAVTRAGLLADAKHFDEGLAMLSKALALHPGEHTLRYERAMMYERAGRSRDATHDFEALLADRPDDPSVLNSLGYTLVDHQRDLPRAEHLIRRAVEIMPDNPALIDSLAWALFRRGEPNAALPLLERAWNLSYDDEIAAHWGEVLWSTGDQGRARSVWTRALVRNSRAVAVAATMQRLGAVPAAKPPAK